MILKQEVTQKLNQSQILRVTLLQMSSLELDTYLQELSESNPVVELELDMAAADISPDTRLLQKFQWLEESDYQNRFYRSAPEDAGDPLAAASTTGGLEDTLSRFLQRQIQGLSLHASLIRAVRYLADCLDDDGYLRVPLEDLSQVGGISMDLLSRALPVLQSLEPAGVGAQDLSQCLALQLERSHYTGPALEIVRHHLPAMARGHYHAIAAQLGIQQSQVMDCCRLIQQLSPRPGAGFETTDSVGYIQPDVSITLEAGAFQVVTRRGQRPPFQISTFYQDLLKQSDDPHVLEYLTEKLRQAENVLQAVEQRESTLQRCAQVIAREESRFFREGPIALVPLRMADVAQELGVHESTVSRALRGKYLQCPKGIFSMSYFFSRSSAPSERSGANASARTRLRQLIDQEPKDHPLSDQQLCQMLTLEGYDLSRRTVAKYREQMNIPGTSGRRRNVL